MKESKERVDSCTNVADLDDKHSDTAGPHNKPAASNLQDSKIEVSFDDRTSNESKKLNRERIPWHVRQSWRRVRPGERT